MKFKHSKIIVGLVILSVGLGFSYQNWVNQNWKTSLIKWNGLWVDEKCGDVIIDCLKVSIQLDKMIVVNNGQRHEGTGDLFPVKVLEDFSYVKQIILGDDRGYYLFELEGNYLNYYMKKNDADDWKLKYKLLKR